MTWTMKRRALRLNERAAAAYSARSDRACIAATLASASMRQLFVLICTAAVACAPPPEREITGGMTEYAFLPNTIEVTAAQRVRITGRNTGRTEHDFAPDQRGVALGLQHLHLAPGASQSFDWTAPTDATEVRVICTIVGHEAFGMVARLVVNGR